MSPSPEVEALKESGGWPALDLTKIDQLDEDQRRQVLDIANLYRDVFAGSEAGKYVLAEMTELYFGPRVANPGDDLITIGIHQGAQDVIRRIRHLIHLAQTGGISTE